MSSPRAFNASAYHPEITSRNDVGSGDEYVDQYVVIPSSSTSKSSNSVDQVVTPRSIQFIGQFGPNTNLTELAVGTIMDCGYRNVNDGSSSTQEVSSHHQNSQMVSTCEGGGTKYYQTSTVTQRSSSTTTEPITFIRPPPTHESHDDGGGIVVSGSLKSSSIHELFQRNNTECHNTTGQPEQSNEDRDDDINQANNDATITKEDHRKVESHLTESLDFNEHLEETPDSSIESSEGHNGIVDEEATAIALGLEVCESADEYNPSSAMSKSDTDVSPIESNKKNTLCIKIANPYEADPYDPGPFMDYESMKPRSNSLQGKCMVQPDGDVGDCKIPVDETTPLISEQSTPGIGCLKLSPCRVIGSIVCGAWFCCVLLVIVVLGTVLYEVGMFTRSIHVTNRTWEVF